MRANVEIKCPKCGSERIEPRTRTDDYSREWIDTACQDCGHGLTYEEIGRQLVQQTLKAIGEPHE